ncbi:hydantoinase B/oxoprolinase family protein [Acuticoccus kandeliae]|uniref:hydantoinase B/oxoprolinase family protein n=1 Tax=Acuticoccus kandeliae TaxID=2073160 RepID=UPI00196A93D3|nr:hydantoinase B/oxoprolinase family protein [Acuticoccus kandeliae]
MNIQTVAKLTMERSTASSGVKMALLSNRMEGIARKMQNTLFRTARSGVLNTAHDFSCVVLTADCRLLATAESLPIHTLLGPDLMCQAVRRHHPTLKAGDCYIHNSPYEGNSHAADHCLIVPVVDEGGTPRFFVLAKAHQADCGNSKPTTYMGDVSDVYEEGALIFSAAKIQSGYRDNQDLIRMCRARIRVSEQWWGDYLATLAAVRIGERELLALGEEFGWDALEDYAESWFDYSEEKMIQAIRRLATGAATVHSGHDPFPGVPDGIPVNVSIKIDADAARIEVDLTDNVDCQPCGLNLTEGTASTAAMIGIYNAIKDHSVPVNSGSFRRIDIKLRENCAVGIPRHPASCSVATTNLADRVSNPVQRGIAEIAPGFGMGEGGPIMPPAMGVISGKHPGSGEAFVNQIFLGITGGPGTPTTDGFLTLIHTGNAGLCRQDSVEVDELHHPLFVNGRQLVPDSEGPGAFRGAPAMEAEFGPIDGCEMTLIYTSDGTINPAAGAAGGGAGALADQYKRRTDGTLEKLPACHAVKLSPGETVLSYSCGGGGYGRPETRDAVRVLTDVAAGLVTAERARDVYRVAIVTDAAGFPAIDEGATAALRARG